jgi:hypothetical protein
MSPPVLKGTKVDDVQEQTKVKVNWIMRNFKVNQPLTTTN